MGVAAGFLGQEFSVANKVGWQKQGDQKIASFVEAVRPQDKPKLVGQEDPKCVGILPPPTGVAMNVLATGLS